MKTLLFISVYNAQNLIGKTLARIPAEVWEHVTEVLIVNDASTDSSATIVGRLVASSPYRSKIRFLSNPKNRGYGGTQKLAYRHACERDFDFVIMLHGDGQYAPELLMQFVEAGRLGHEIVFGTRFGRTGAPLKGGMPFYKWLGNQFLTFIQNRMLGCRLSELHCGYRAYSTRFLKSIPFQLNSDDFDFDTEIVAQACATGFEIHEMDIPTFYGEEVCHVNGPKYALQILWDSFCFLLNRAGLVRIEKYALKSAFSGEENRPAA